MARSRRASAPGSLSPQRYSRPPVARMMKIHELLAAGRFPNCSKLAGEFEVSSKTIQRDIDFMRDQLMLPIDYDQVRHGFRYTKPVDQFPLVNVNEGELVALLVAQKAIEQYRGTLFEKPLRSAFDKLTSSLDQKTSVSLHELSEAVSFRPVGVPVEEMKVYGLLADAMVAGEVVEFDYLSLKATKPERRRVEPLHLTCIDGQWYLIAHDQVRGAGRTFALIRMRRCKNLRKRFAKPEKFSVAEMMAGSFAAFESREPVDVVIDFDGSAARLIVEKQWHRSQKVEPLTSGGVRLHLTVGVAPDLEKWILGWGAHARVVAPAALREKMRDTARQLSAIYR